jgi:hypothetical protein
VLFSIIESDKTTRFVRDLLRDEDIVEAIKSAKSKLEVLSQANDVPQEPLSDSLLACERLVACLAN